MNATPVVTLRVTSWIIILPFWTTVFRAMSGFKVIIIGGGMAGCLLGNGLLRHNIDFQIYESDPADAKREGYQIRLGAPALEGFKACMTEEQLKKLYPLFGRSGGVLSSAPITYDIHMNPLLDLTKFPAYTKPAPINCIVLVNYLSEPLVTAKRLHYGNCYVRYQTFKDGSRTKIRAIFDDGSSEECDLLISAEGSRSKGRVLYWLHEKNSLVLKAGYRLTDKLDSITLFSSKVARTS